MPDIDIKCEREGEEHNVSISLDGTELHRDRGNVNKVLVRSKPTAYGRATLIGSADPA